MKKAMLLALAFTGFIGLAAFEVSRAAWATSCSWIAWDGQQPTCVVAQSDASFSFNLTTSTYSDLQPSSFDYYLNVAYTSGTSSNIDNGAVNPGSWSVYQTGAFGPDTCSGTLHTPTQDGSFVISAWDSPQAHCSGTWTVTIKRNGQSCS